MKKFLALASFLLLVSCCYPDQKIKVNLNINSVESNIGEGKSVKILVIDQRKNKEKIGYKKLGDRKILITLDQDPAIILKEEISKNLLKKGFRLGNEKTLTIQLNKLKYKAKRGLVIGESKAKGEITITIRNNKNGSKFSKNYNISLDNKHFIAPSKAKDAKIINSILHDLVSDLLSDEQFLENLAE